MANLTCSDGTVIQISAETEEELRRQFGPKKPEFGDVVEHKDYGYKRIVLYDAHGKLQVYSIDSCDSGPYIQTTQGAIPRTHYTPTGKNIFKDNLLGLTR